MSTKKSAVVQDPEQPEFISDIPKQETDHELEKMAARMRALQSDLETLEKAKEQVTSMLMAIRDNDIPEWMMAAEISEYRLPDGALLELQRDVYTSINKADRDGVMKWLVEQGADHLIKHVMTITFARGEHAKAQAFKRMIEKILPQADIEIFAGKSAEQIGDALRAILAESFPDHTVEDEWQVHGGQLKAFIGKALKQGINVPTELGIYSPHVAVVREPASNVIDSNTSNDNL